jgi:hypothetical protein
MGSRRSNGYRSVSREAAKEDLCPSAPACGGLHWGTVRSVPRYPVYVLLLTTAINALNFMDRSLVAAVAPLLKAEFGLTDLNLGC